MLVGKNIGNSSRLQVVVHSKVASIDTCFYQHLWRNGLARLAVNQKVGGSSPPRCDGTF